MVVYNLPFILALNYFLSLCILLTLLILIYKLVYKYSIRLTFLSQPYDFFSAVQSQLTVQQFYSIIFVFFFVGGYNG